MCVVHHLLLVPADMSEVGIALPVVVNGGKGLWYHHSVITTPDKYIIHMYQ